jgi:shikimate kinase
MSATPPDALPVGPTPATRGSGARNLVLIGYRGCGKTAVGRVVAQRCGWAFVDTDERIVVAAGRTIRDIFAADGEPAFRQLESAVIAEVCRATHQVISVGGGAILSAQNRIRLRSAGACIWLTAPPAELFRRMQADPHDAATRPALTAAGGLAEVRHLLAQREPLYALLAQHVVDTTGRSVAEVADNILTRLGHPGRSPDTRA